MQTPVQNRNFGPGGEQALAGIAVAHPEEFFVAAGPSRRVIANVTHLPTLPEGCQPVTAP
jgi:hypothetical protein